MDSDEACFEQSVCECLRRGARDEAATRFLGRHGDAIFAFLADRLRDRREAEEVFGQFAEDFWRGLSGFQGRASMRSWAFTLARNAASRHRRGPHRRAARNLPLPEDSQLADLAARWRSNTPAYQQTVIKDQLRELRRKLSEEDQTLLVLRIDQKLSWSELAEVLSGDRDPKSPADHAREVERLRQRFKRAKEQLRKLAQTAGVLS